MLFIRVCLISSYNTQMRARIFLFLFLTLLTVICCGFFLATNVLNVSCFGKKGSTDARNLNVTGSDWSYVDKHPCISVKQVHLKKKK